ncbi:MAG: DUF6544 family protein [Pseudomonadota bacterium]
MIWMTLSLALLLAFGLALHGLRQLDLRAEAAVWKQLLERAGPNEGLYDPQMVASLPEPAQRYFNFMIRAGTPLFRVIDIQMEGTIGFGSKDAPNEKPMSAKQILAPPYGLVWSLKSGVVGGSDVATTETSWTRFWLLSVIPLVRASNPDHRRAAFGRVVVEAAAWVPATLLPSDHVHWEAIDDNRSKAIVRFGDFTQAVNITVDKSGAPRTVMIQRWTDANPDKVFRQQPFGGHLSEFVAFDGYRLPTRIEVGNHFGTDDYFPFLKARITQASFPQKGIAQA